MDEKVALKLLGGVAQTIAIWEAPTEDPEGMRLRYVNPQADLTSGFKLSGWVGATLAELAAPIREAGGNVDLQLAGDFVTRGHVFRACRNQQGRAFDDPVWQRERAFVLQIVPLGDHRAATVWTDVTENVLALRARREDLRRTLYVLSHDLRKPVRHMIGFAQAFVEDFGATPGVHKGVGFLDEMRNAGERMELLLDGILQFAQLGHVDKWEVVDLVESWTIAVTDYVIDGSGASLSPSVEGTPPNVFGSKAMIFQLLTNLVANSVKFCPPPVEMVLRAYPCKDLPDRICVEIQDNGPGIPKAQREEVFVLFRRGRDAKDVPGMGLGLAVCRWIAEAHGGSIRIVDSDVGTLFRIHLPAVTRSPR